MNPLTEEEINAFCEGDDDDCGGRHDDRWFQRITDTFTDLRAKLAAFQGAQADALKELRAAWTYVAEGEAPNKTLPAMATHLAMLCKATGAKLAEQERITAAHARANKRCRDDNRRLLAEAAEHQATAERLAAVICAGCANPEREEDPDWVPDAAFVEANETIGDAILAERYARIRAEERERCAQTCDEQAAIDHFGVTPGEALSDAASTIRALADDGGGG